jgi:hypothetical protein
LGFWRVEGGNFAQKLGLLRHGWIENISLSGNTLYIWCVKTREDNTMTLDKFKDKQYGKHGTEKREELEEGYENFKLGATSHSAGLEKCLTKETVKQKVGSD